MRRNIGPAAAGPAATALAHAGLGWTPL